jgi:hypothetical protein
MIRLAETRGKRGLRIGRRCTSTPGLLAALVLFCYKAPSIFPANGK